MPVRLWACSVMMRGSSGTAEFVKLVGEALDADGEEAGVAEDRFIGALGGGIAVEGGLDVGGEQFANRGQAIEKFRTISAGFLIAIGAFRRRCLSELGICSLVTQATADLLVENIGQFEDQSPMRS